MTKEEIKDFSMRICQGSSNDLVVTTFYIIDNYLEEAKKAFNESREKDFSFNINKAKQFINNLAGSLDYKYDLAYDLRKIYSFTNKSLVAAIVKRDDSEIERVQGILAMLRTGFEKVCNEEEIKKPAMQNSQKIYAGLTYSKGKLNEYALRRA